MPLEAIETPLGAAFVGRHISIRKFLQRLDMERVEWEAMEAPLTDYAYSDVSEAGREPPRRRDLLARLLAARFACQRSPIPTTSKDLTRKQKKNKQSDRRQKLVRAKIRPPGAQKGVVKKRAQQAAEVTFRLPMNIGSCTSITANGWTGKSVNGFKLPRTAYTIGRLEDREGMVRFDWDGM
jgi:hypothetical protein